MSDDSDDIPLLHFVDQGHVSDILTERIHDVS